jgi:hypothetical protein
MKAKLISENMGFERGKTPEEIKSLFTGNATYKQILDTLCEEPVWEKLEQFVNDYIIDTVATKYEKFHISDLKKAMNVLMNEAVDLWDGSREEDEVDVDDNV